MNQKIKTILIISAITTLTLGFSTNSIADKDGYGKGFHNKKNYRMFKHIDKDKDGKLSVEEVENSITKIFNKLDENDDGKINENEKFKHFKKLYGYQTSEDDQEPTLDDLKAQAIKHHTAADSDKDGKVTREEMVLGKIKQTFSLIDSDNNNSLSEEEYIKHAQKRLVKKK